MAKIKGRRGYRFIKELGGAVLRETVSTTAEILVERSLILDYGCGFDAHHFGWEAFDPHYRQKPPGGVFDTVVCDHVANMLTRSSRHALFAVLLGLLAPGGTAYLSVSRKIPTAGKIPPTWRRASATSMRASAGTRPSRRPPPRSTPRDDPPRSPPSSTARQLV